MAKRSTAALDLPQGVTADPGELVQAAVTQHFRPETGSPCWLERAKTLNFSPRLARRSVLRGLGAGALATGAGGILAACSSGANGTARAASRDTITVGFISPLTGPLVGFASGDRFVIDTIRATPAYAKGFTVGGKKYQVNIIVADSRSDPNRASQLARQLIVNVNVDMLLTTSTPETTNPVAVVAQTEGVPCVSTVCPWESWYAGLGGNPAKPTKTFQYVTLFFFGLKEFQGCFVPMWNRVPAANKR